MLFISCQYVSVVPQIKNATKGGVTPGTNCAISVRIAGSSAAVVGVARMAAWLAVYWRTSKQTIAISNTLDTRVNIWLRNNNNGVNPYPRTENAMEKRMMIHLSLRLRRRVSCLLFPLEPLIDENLFFNVTNLYSVRISKMPPIKRLMTTIIPMSCVNMTDEILATHMMHYIISNMPQHFWRYSARELYQAAVRGRRWQIALL